MDFAEKKKMIVQNYLAQTHTDTTQTMTTGGDGQLAVALTGTSFQYHLEGD